MSGRLPRLVIAAATTGAGKTAVATGLMAALRARGLRVAPFKVGPDFIDPGHHAAAAGRSSRNLDTWMLPPPTVQALFQRAAADADIAVVEGVMGLFDGLRPDRDDASTAEVARLLEAPVVAVLDGFTAARTLAATALGLVRLDPRLRVVGWLVNRCPPGEYADRLKAAITGATGLPVFGTIAHQEAIAVPERHLGLRPAAEGAGWVEAAGRAVQAGVDLEAMIAAATAAAHLPTAPTLPWCVSRAPLARVAWAWDTAFHFYYEDALDLLRACGLELVPWSPLADPDLPPDVDGAYIGGGYPELFAADLSVNVGALRALVARGAPVYGECGGFMYLCREVVDLDGRAHAMAGLVPARAVMTARPAGFGYREAHAVRDSLLLRVGERVRGHEFHYSRAEWADPLRSAWDLWRPAGGAAVPDGYAGGNTLAGYVHLHLCGLPAAAERFAAACVRARERRRGRV